MKKIFRIIWIIIAVAVFIGGLVYVLMNKTWQSWLIWGIASAVVSIGTVLLNFFSRFRGCLGTVIFLILSILLGPVQLLVNIVSTAIAIKKDN